MKMAQSIGEAFGIAQRHRGTLVPLMDTVEIDGKTYSRNTDIACVMEARMGDSHPYGIYVAGESETRWFVSENAAIEFAVAQCRQS